MKNLLVFLILWVAFKGNTCAQPYESIFGQQSTYWIIEWSNLFGTTSDTLTVTKDTVVNGLNYKKVELKSNPTIFANKGLLREDFVSKRIWYRSLGYDINPSDTIEQLIFNLNLNIGDTFDIKSDLPIDDSLKIVDLVETVNNVKVIKFKSKNTHNENVSFIEGIGPNIGVLYKQFQSPIIGDYLLCAYKDGVRTFVNGYYKTCDRTFSGIEGEVVNHINFQVQPNPVENSLVLSSITSAESVQWEIVDVRGIPQLKGMDTILKDKDIDISNLSNGVYILVIRTPFRFETHRIIKL